jgi:hypothetical protein
MGVGFGLASALLRLEMVFLAPLILDFDFLGKHSVVVHARSGQAFAWMRGCISWSKASAGLRIAFLHFHGIGSKREVFASGS